MDYLSRTFWTDDEIKFREEVRAFCDKEITPIADKLDKGPYPRELIRKIGKAGYMGVHHEKAAGGSARGLSYEIIVAEEISRCNGGLDMARMASATLYGMPVSKFGTPEQKEEVPHTHYPRRQGWLHWHHRTGRGLRYGRHEDACCEGR